MKNKLVKTGHKKFYYRFRNASLGCLVAVALAGLVALPITISYQNEQIAKAEEAAQIVETEESSDSITVSSYVER